MEASKDAMQAAVRVLTALREKRTPDPADVVTLRQFDEAPDGRDLDMLACDVIQKAIKRRAGSRGTT